MRLRPNKSVIDATVKRVAPAADGVGGDVVVIVHTCAPAGNADDFIGAAAGAELTLFSAEPSTLEAGRSYRLMARVLGGPNGERLIVESAEPKKTR